MLQKLSQPFPDKAGFKQSLITIFWVGVFVGLFLFFIRPFGIEGEWVDLTLASVYFAGVTIVFGWIFEVVTRFVLKIQTNGPNWTLGKWIIFSFILVVWIALGNFLMVNMLSEWRAMGYFNFLRMIGYTSLIGIFPVILSGILIQLRATQQNEESASDLSENLHPKKPDPESLVVLEADGGSLLTLNVSEVRYIEAMQNYISVHHMQDAKLTKTVLRATVSGMAEKFEGTDVIRCHRSFLVNADHIQKVEGNAQGLRLQLSGVEDHEVPVSRSFIPKLRELLS